MPTGSDMFRDRPCLISREQIAACLTKLPPDIWPSCWRYWTLPRSAYPTPRCGPPSRPLPAQTKMVQSLAAATCSKDDHGAAFPPEVIEIMTTALEAVVATLPEPVHSAHL